MKKILKRLRYFKISDFIAPILFFIALIPSFCIKIINKIKRKKLWVICEDGNTARDNGYYFFKFVCEFHPEVKCFYVINNKASDFNKIKDYKNIIQFKSIKHWIYYLAANYNFSIHKHGNPCQSFFYIIHVIFKLYNNRVFLQHGITKDDSEWLYYKNTRFRYFICGAKKEYEYICEKFGYPEGNVIYTGFPRFDNLNKNETIDKQILIMPTWRNWLGGNYVTKSQFENTKYFNYWNDVLNDKELKTIAEKNNLKIYFYPHQHTQKFLSSFSSGSKNIIILDNSKKDIQEILKESKLLITDYSSVFMDFAYMYKPIIFYQFDYNEYREKQLKDGYFSYLEDGFGKVINEHNDLINQIKFYYNNGFVMEEKYYKRVDDFFEIRDCSNCERIYNFFITK